MASILKPKRRSTDGTAPTTANLADGEVAINAVTKTIYQRIGAAVVAVANFFTDAPSDGTTYGRKDAGWVAISSGGISDAPSDGKYYGRKDGAWAQVGQPEVVNITTSITLTSAHLNKVLEANSTSNITLTIPAGLGTQGDMITVVHSKFLGKVTVARGSGVQLWRIGSSGDHIIDKYGMMTFYKTADANIWTAA